jgi:hypothetical protein
MPFYNGLQLELGMNTFARAFTSINSSLVAVAYANPVLASATWTQNASVFNDFIIKDVRLVVKKYKLSEPIYKAIAMQYASTGWTVPYSKFNYDSFSVPYNVQLASYQLNKPEIRSLDKMIFILQTENQAVINDCKYAHWEYSMGNEHRAMSNLLAPTAPVVPYNGLTKIVMRYNSDYIHADIEDLMTVRPYKTDFYKNMAISCFSQPEKCNFLRQLYDGVNNETGVFNNLNTSFFVAIDFRSVAGSERSGIDLSKSPIFFEFYFGAKTSASHLLRVHAISVAGAEMEIKQGTSPLSKT